MSWWATQGLKTWAWQRLSAIYLALYLIGALTLFASEQPYTYRAWLDLFAHPIVSIASAGFFLALCVHAWVGVRDIVFDYVKPYSLRLLALALVIVSLIYMFLWSLRILVLVNV